MITEQLINEYSQDPKFIEKLDEWLPQFQLFKPFRFFYRNDMMHAEIIMLENLRILNKCSNLSSNQRKWFSILLNHLIDEYENWKKNGDNTEVSSESGEISTESAQ